LVNKVSIEKATPDQIDAIASIEKEGFPSAWNRETYIKEMAHNVAVFLVAILDGKVIGFALSWNSNNRLHILKIGVDKKYRDQGIGSKLMKRTFIIASEANTELAFLEVRKSNIPALTFYKKLGFSILGINNNYYTDTGEDAIIMFANMEQIYKTESC